jgi:hypothetical protein
LVSGLKFVSFEGQECLYGFQAHHYNPEIAEIFHADQQMAKESLGMFPCFSGYKKFAKKKKKEEKYYFQ